MKRLIAISVNILIYLIAQSQTKYSLSEQMDMLKTYSFYLGQKESINYIVEKFPILKYEAIKAQNNWELRYLASIQNIVSVLKDNLGEDFGNYEKEILVSIQQMDYSIFTEEDAKMIIMEINSRVQGDMPSLFLETLLSFDPIYDKIPYKEITDGYYKEYYTNESLKSYGLNLKIIYPKSWKEQEGDRPHVIKKFRSHNGYGNVIIGIGIQKSLVSLTDSDIKILLSEEGMKSDIPKTAKTLSINTQLKICKQPAACITYYNEQIQMNETINTIIEIFQVYYNDFQITIFCSVGSSKQEYEEIYKDYLKNKDLFWQIANNLAILSKYEK